jgi:maltose alpha-D-glucosyltransferase/alpha-amylase
MSDQPDANTLTPITVEWHQPLTRDTLSSALTAVAAAIVPALLPHQRWYGEKGRTLARVEMAPPAVIERDGVWIALCVVTLAFSEGDPATYFVPSVIGRDPADREFAIIQDADRVNWHVSDAAAHLAFQGWLFDAASTGGSIGDAPSRMVWRTPGAPLDIGQVPSRLLTGEQSNSNIAYGNTMLIKVLRRVQTGVNPDVELGRYLSQTAEIESVPRLLADWSLHSGEGEASLGIAQAFVAGAEDGWQWLLDQLAAAGSDPDVQSSLAEAIRLLGARTGEIHNALAAADDPEIAPNSISEADAAVWKTSTRALLNGLLPAVKATAPAVEDVQTRTLVDQFIVRAPDLVSDLTGFDGAVGMLKTRVHGDYHLGQTLQRNNDWIIIDFEGEPARSLEARRARSSPLKDVAGMIRSLAYATAFASREPGAWADPERTLEAAFLNGYRSLLARPDLVPAADRDFQRALSPWIIDKAIYEIAYELNNRPAWLWAPIASLLMQVAPPEAR